MVQRYRPVVYGQSDREFTGICKQDSNGDYTLYSDYTALERERDELTERVRELAAEIAEPTIKELDILYRIRKAIGDNGKMMQDELVDHIEGLVRRVKELEEIVELKDAAYQIAKSAGTELLAENAMLKKRLEPIESVWNSRLDGNGYDWGMDELDMQEAIKKCVELKEGE